MSAIFGMATVRLTKLAILQLLLLRVAKVLTNQCTYKSLSFVHGMKICKSFCQLPYISTDIF